MSLLHNFPLCVYIWHDGLQVMVGCGHLQTDEFKSCERITNWSENYVRLQGEGK